MRVNAIHPRHALKLYFQRHVTDRFVDCFMAYGAVEDVSDCRSTKAFGHQANK